MSPRPGSTIGLRPLLTAATFSSLTSTPTTSWPSAAKFAAETHPTYPSPNTETFMWPLPLLSCRELRLFTACRQLPAASRKRLHAFTVDEGAIPEFEIGQRPDGVAAIGAAVAVRVEQLFDGAGVDDAALARGAIEQHVADDAVPGAARPVAERHREAHLRARQDFVG